MTDLYETLGVIHNATADQIKKAYRTLAKKHHPDVGGDPDTFNALTLAYDVLSDVDARVRYDTTGELPKGAAQHENQEALAIIGQLVEALVQDIVMRDGLEHDDLVAKMVSKVDEQIKSVMKDRDEALKFEQKALKLRKRFKAKSGVDYIGSMLDRKIEVCRGAVANAATSLATLEKARKMVLAHEFEVEPRPAAMPGSYTAYRQANANAFFRFGQT